MDSINKADNDFLYPGILVFPQAFANCLRSTNERGRHELIKIVALCLSQLRDSPLLCFCNGTIINESSAPDGVVITAKLIAMVFEDGELVLDCSDIPADVARIGVLGYELEGDLFTSPTDQALR